MMERMAADVTNTSSSGFPLADLRAEGESGGHSPAGRPLALPGNVAAVKCISRRLLSPLPRGPRANPSLPQARGDAELKSPGTSMILRTSTRCKPPELSAADRNLPTNHAKTVDRG